MKRLLMLCLLLAACDPGAARPVDPAWSKQPCAHCMMLLSDKHTAAQLWLASGERRYFDDVGCLVSSLADEKLSPAAIWVRTPDGLGWAPAATAHFASGGRTPMDFGYVPADVGISWAELVRQVRSRTPAAQGAER